MISLTESLKILLVLSSTILCKTNAFPTSVQASNATNSTQFSWIQQMRDLRNLVKECENSSSAKMHKTSTWQCFKITSLNIVDDVLRHRVISLWPGVRLVQRSDIMETPISNKLNPNYWQRKDFKYLTWFDRLTLRVTKMLKSHILEINLKELTEAYIDRDINRKDSFQSNSTNPLGTARHRRQRINMMMTMMFGVTAFGAVIVPMGFQLLSIVSGKALLLAKMALLLASINGLKRVANTGVHYGLYHTPGENYGHYYDRGDVHHPRNVQNVVPVSQPDGMDLNI